MARVPKQSIFDAVVVTAELMGQELPPRAAEAMARELAAEDPAAVLTALRRCQRELTGRLTLAAILARLDDGRPGVEQAWAICAQARDEDVTLVWTAEMSQAWGVARKLPDDIAARMAFKEAYAEAVLEARTAGERVRWTITMGHDASRRAGAILDAVEAGRLPAHVAREHVHAGLPDFETAHARLMRLEGKRARLPSGEARQAIEKLTAGIGKALP